MTRNSIMSASTLKKTVGKTRAKQVAQSVKHAVPSLQTSAQDIGSSGGPKTSKAMTSKDWRKSESTGSVISETTNLPGDCSVDTVVEKMATMELESAFEDWGLRKPHSRMVAWESMTTAPATKTTFATAEIEFLKSTPALIRDVKHVVMKDTNGNPMNLPNTYAFDISTAEMKYISSGNTGLSLAELKRVKNPYRLRRNSSDNGSDLLEEIREAIATTPVREVASGRRSASVSPEFLIKAAGIRHGEVSRARELEQIMQQDPAIDCIDGVESPNRRRSPPSGTDLKRFTSMFSRLGSLHPTFAERLERCKIENQRPSARKSNDIFTNAPVLESKLATKADTSTLPAPAIVNGSPYGSPSKLNPEAVEFHSFALPKRNLVRGKITDAFPDVNVSPPNYSFPAASVNISPPCYSFPAPVMNESPEMAYRARLAPSPPFTGSPEPPMNFMPHAGQFNTFAGQITPPMGYSPEIQMQIPMPVQHRMSPVSHMLPPALQTYGPGYAPTGPTPNVPPMGPAVNYPAPPVQPVMPNGPFPTQQNTNVGNANMQMPYEGPNMTMPYAGQNNNFNHPPSMPYRGPNMNFNDPTNMSCGGNMNFTGPGPNHATQHPRPATFGPSGPGPIAGPMQAPQPCPYFPVTTKPRDRDPVKQQAYEAYLEWRKANEPGFAVSCKVRQARRVARQQGLPLAMGPGATGTYPFAA